MSRTRQLGTLLHFRRRRLAHRLAELGAGRAAALAVVGVAALVLLGWLVTPDHLGPSRNQAGVTHWGGWSLEAAFYLGCLICVLQSYRVMEALFRHPDTRALSTIPVHLPDLFVYRFATSIGETALLASLGALFLLPVGLHGAWASYAASVILLALSVPVVVCVGFAAQMGAGAAEYRLMPGVFAELDKRSGGAGGGAAAYLVSPAAGLGGSLGLLLISKMSLDQVFKDSFELGAFALPGITKATAVVLLVACVGCLVWSYRLFTTHYPLLFARFFEADLYTLDVGYDYFAKDRKPPRGIEARLEGRVQALYRLYRLQAARRRPFARLLLIAGPLAAAALFATLGERLDPWMVAGAGLAWLVVIVNPWRNVFHPEMEPGMGRILPVTVLERRTATRVVVWREVLLVSVPIAVAGLLLPGWSRSAAAASLVPLGLLLALVRERVSTTIEAA